MAYIGKTPTIGNFQVCDAISVVNNQAAYTMQVGGVNVSPESANHMLVSLNGILQAPTSSFTVSGSTITFASALETGDVIDFIQILGNVLDLGVPSDSTVSLDKLTATGTKDATTFLRGDNTFASAGITMADQFRLSSDFTGDGDLTANLERNDSTGFGQLGTGMTESSGVFTFPSTGIYLVRFSAQYYNNTTNSRFGRAVIKVTTDNSSYTSVAQAACSINVISSAFTYSQSLFEHQLDVTDTSNVKVMFAADTEANDSVMQGSSTINVTYMTFIRLGDT